MNFTGYLCFGSLTVLLIGLVFHDLPLATIGFMLLVCGMYIVVMDND